MKSLDIRDKLTWLLTKNYLTGRNSENQQGLFKNQCWQDRINILASFQKQNATVFLTKAWIGRIKLC